MPPQPGSVNALGMTNALGTASGPAASDTGMSAMADPGADGASEASEGLIGIDEVQKALNRSRASVYRYTNTDPRNLNPPFNPRRLNPEYRSDQKDALLFHPNEVARFARDVLRIKEVTVEVLNSPSTATQQLLTAILEELRVIRTRLDRLDLNAVDLNAADPNALDPKQADGRPADLSVRRDQQGARPAA